jgi:nucleotide-binding universal stress UspA family protein
MASQSTAKAETSSPNEGATPPYKRILVCCDGSDNASRALRRAIGVAKETHANLSIIVAADTLSYNVRYLMRYYKELCDDILQYAQEQLSDALDLARVEGLQSVQGSVEEGHPSEVILAKASDIDADFIVVGRRGLSSVQRYLLGSISSSIVGHSPCDVLVVKWRVFRGSSGFFFEIGRLECS